MGKFVRKFDGELVKKLQETQLFQLLLEDIKKGEVFPCIRNNLIAFYYKGSLLFKYDKNGFHTHYKFLINNDKEKPYVSGDGTTDSKIDVQNMIIDNFVDGYKSIKQSIGIYAKPEAEFTSGFYCKSFFSEECKGDRILIDIEAAFERPNDVETEAVATDVNSKKRKNVDRIDTVFFDKKLKQIVFCEVKRFNDARLMSQKGQRAEVVGQLIRYETQIKKSERDIINNYNVAFRIYNELFGTPELVVEKVYPQSVLFVTGCAELLYKDKTEGEVEKIRNETGYAVIFRDHPSGRAVNDITSVCRPKK